MLTNRLVLGSDGIVLQILAVADLPVQENVTTPKDGRLIPYLDQFKSVWKNRMFAQCELLSLADYDPNPSWTEWNRLSSFRKRSSAAHPAQIIYFQFGCCTGELQLAFPAFFSFFWLLSITAHVWASDCQAARDLPTFSWKSSASFFGDLAASTWYLKALLEAILMQIPRHGEWYNYHHQALESVLGQSLF